MAYPVVLQPNGESGFVVQVVDVPEALSEGADRHDALANAAEALEVALLGRIKDGDAIPAPSAAEGRDCVEVPAQAAAKLAFYSAFRESGLTRVALAQRLGKDEAEIRRMLDPHHATKLTTLDDALRAMGKRLTLGVEPV